MSNESQEKQQYQQKTQVDYLLSYLSFLFRYKYLIIIITFLAAAGSVTYSIVSLKLPPEESYYPNRYRAYSVLIVGQDNTSSMANLLSTFGINAPAGGNEINYGQLGIRVLQSRPFIDEIVKEHNLTEKYEITEMVRTKLREIVLGSSDFSYNATTGTLTISYEDIDPVFARDMVQSMVSNLQKWFKNWKGSTSQQELQAMRQKIEEVSKEMRRLEAEIEAFQAKYGVLSVEEIAEAQTAMITDLQSQLVQTKVAIQNYTGFSNIEDQELKRLKAERDSLQELIIQLERGQGSGVLKMPSRAELPAMSIEFSHLKISHEIQLRIYQNIKEQYEVQKLTSSEKSVFSILEPAEVPEEKSGPQRSRLCIIVILFGFVFAVILALFIEFIRAIKRDPRKKNLIKGKPNE